MGEISAKVSTRKVSTRKRREITQKEMDDFLCFCEEFYWMGIYDKIMNKKS